MAATPAQISANRQNAAQSTGPRTEEGRAASALNHRSHGFTGRFVVIPGESQEEFNILLADFRAEHLPVTVTEQSYVDQMAQSAWLSKRAMILQSSCFVSDADSDGAGAEKRLSLYLRYQTTADRRFDKCLNQLQSLRKQRHNEEIGFESQKLREAQAVAEETRKQEAHEAKTRLANAKAQATEIDSEVRHTMQAPLPGCASLPFEELAVVFRTVLGEVSAKLEQKLKAAA